MKKQLAVFKLFINRSIYETIIITLLMVVIEAGMMIIGAYNAVAPDGYGVANAWFIFESSHAAIPFIFGLIAVVILALGVKDGRSHTDYTYKRMALSATKVQALFFASAVVNLLVYWFMQMIAVFALLNITTKIVGAGETMTGIWLGTHKSMLLHMLLPVGDPLRVIKNVAIVLLFAASVATSYRVYTFGNAKRFAVVVGNIVSIVVLWTLYMSARFYKTSVAFMWAIAVLVVGAYIIIGSRKNPENDDIDIATHHSAYIAKGLMNNAYSEEKHER